MSSQNSFDARRASDGESAVLAVIEKKTLNVRQRVPDHAMPERHSPVHRRPFAHHVVSQRRPAKRALNQEQSVDVLRDELRVLQSKRQGVARPAAVSDDDQFFTARAGNLLKLLAHDSGIACH